MKKFNLTYIIIISMFSCIWLITINAQEKSISDFLQDFLKPQLSVVEEKQPVNVEENIKRAAWKNINEFFKKADNFRKQGKSSEEIHKILKMNNISGTGSISGKIYESDGITPVKNLVTIEVFDKYGIYSGYDIIGTYDNGDYLIQNLPAGKYYVKSESDAYLDEYYDNETTWQKAILVEVIDGQETSQINFSLEQHKGVISGNVVGPNGSPLSNCFISAQSVLSSSYSYGSTDNNGNYKLEYLSPDIYKVYCYYEGSENFTGQWYDNSDNYEDADSVILSAEDTVKNINFKLKSGGAIVGKITKKDGSLFTEYEVYINLYSIDSEYSMYSQPIDSTGAFIINKLNAGNYQLKAEYHGYENYTNIWFNNSYAKDDAQVIQVQRGDTVKNINFSLKPGGSISGKIIVPSVSVSGNVIVYDKDVNYISSVYANTSENYLIERLTPGNYKIQADFPDYEIQWYDNKNDFESADLVSVSSDDTTKGIDFNLKQLPPAQTAEINGFIYNPDGVQCQGQISLYDLNNQRILYQYAFGFYSISGIPPGEYKIAVYNSDFGTEWYINKNSYQRADTIKLMANQIKTINFKFDYLSSIAGFSIDEEGNRVDGEKQNIFAAVFDAFTGDYIIDRNVTFNGGYRIILRPGNYKLALVPTYINDQEEYDSLARTFYKNGNGFNDTASLIINLGSQMDLELEEIKIEKASGSISGVIYNLNDNLPIDSTNYLLFAYDENGFYAKGSFYSLANNLLDGFYKIIGLHPGKYHVLALVASENDNLNQWYNGINADLSINDIALKMNLPNNIEAIDVGFGETSGINFYFNISTNINNHTILVNDFKLNQNYPNPFNGYSVIKYSIPNSSNVIIKVFDVLGTEIQTLVNEEKEAGYHSIDFNAIDLPSGVYFYRIQSGNFIDTKKMILIK